MHERVVRKDLPQVIRRVAAFENGNPKNAGVCIKRNQCVGGA